MELWGDEPNVYTVGILSPGGENIERMQLKMGEFQSIPFSRKYIIGNTFFSRSNNRRFAGNPDEF